MFVYGSIHLLLLPSYHPRFTDGLAFISVACHCCAAAFLCCRFSADLLPACSPAVACCLLAACHFVLAFVLLNPSSAPSGFPSSCIFLGTILSYICFPVTFPATTTCGLPVQHGTCAGFTNGWVPPRDTKLFTYLYCCLPSQPCSSYAFPFTYRDMTCLHFYFSVSCLFYLRLLLYLGFALRCVTCTTARLPSALRFGHCCCTCIAVTYLPVHLHIFCRTWTILRASAIEQQTWRAARDTRMIDRLRCARGDIFLFTGDIARGVSWYQAARMVAYRRAGDGMARAGDAAGAASGRHQMNGDIRLRDNSGAWLASPAALATAAAPFLRCCRWLHERLFSAVNWLFGATICWRGQARKARRAFRQRGGS